MKNKKKHIWNLLDFWIISKRHPEEGGNKIKPELIISFQPYSIAYMEVFCKPATPPENAEISACQTVKPWWQLSKCLHIFCFIFNVCIFFFFLGSCSGSLNHIFYMAHTIYFYDLISFECVIQTGAVNQRWRVHYWSKYIPHQTPN